jgi:16S rRNA (guanine(966)-N(2))-methyltransferase RsmD
MVRPRLIIPKEVPKQHASAPQARHVVRIIGGQWKRSQVPVADVPGLRPTPDRVRETLFNWLGHQFGGSLETRTALDVFAGTGALGFEAASRGAKRAVLIDSHPAALKCLYALSARLKAQATIHIIAGTAQTVLARLAQQAQVFDIIFLDPPFHEGLIERIMPQALALLAPSGVLYVEAEAPLADANCEQWGLELLRKDKAGQVFYHMLRRNIKNEKFRET